MKSITWQYFSRIFSKCSIAWQCLAEHVQYFLLSVFFKVQYCLAVFSSAWAIFRGMRCEALPASLYVNSVRADSAFMIKNANSTFHGQ